MKALFKKIAALTVGIITRFAAGCSRQPDVAFSHEEATVSVTEVSEVSEGSKATEVSEGSKATEVSEGSKVTEVSEGSKATEVSEGSKVTEVSEDSKVTEVSGATEELLILWYEDTLLIPRSAVEIRTLTPEEVEYVVLHNRTRGAITASPNGSRGNLWAVSTQTIEVDGIVVAEQPGLFMKVAMDDTAAGILPEQDPQQPQQPQDLDEFTTRWAISSDNIDVYVVEDETTIKSGIVPGAYVLLADVEAQNEVAHSANQVVILWEGSKHGLILREKVQFIDRSLPITG